MPEHSGILYVIGTPIGNLHDISERAKQVLQEVDRVLAEDTRHSRRLLEHFGINTPLQSYHDFNERSAVTGILESLRLGLKLALISDAGTPLISDPGYHLVKAAHEQGVAIVPIPGPSAVATALSVAGMAADKFIFEGFLPGKPAARKKRLQEIAGEPRTLVFYEAPHRILGFLMDVKELYGSDRMVCVCRELTKKFETIYRGAATDVLDILTHDPQQQRGEFVVVIQGAGEPVARDAGELNRILGILLEHGLPVKEASGIAAQITGTRKNELYQLALKLAGN